LVSMYITHYVIVRGVVPVPSTICASLTLQELGDLGAEVTAESQRYALAIATLQQRYETARSEGLAAVAQVRTYILRKGLATMAQVRTSKLRNGLLESAASVLNPIASNPIMTTWS
jgi:hypothetical protein